ncbi:MAG TPA: response regulator [Opitutaceae bacterium]|nr:response regulator [Opitutaceae bacterium]
MSRILLVDDEESVRVTIGALLKAHGHEVVTAVDGKEGVEQFVQDTFDLVITDVLMPRMGGAATIATLRQIRPGLRVIAISGAQRVAADGAAETASRLRADRLLIKPFAQEELLAAVAEVLGDATAGPAGT